MALTSNDETDLLLPLFQAGIEKPRFSTFLDRLRRRSQSELVGLLVRTMPDGPAMLSEASPSEYVTAHERFADQNGLLGLDRAQLAGLRKMRVYALDELLDSDPARRSAALRETSARGLRDARIMRIGEDSSFEAWLFLARRHECTGADSALLANLAPYLQQTIDGIAASGRRQFRENLALQALSHARRGWLALDAQGRVLGMSDFLAQNWPGSDFAVPPPTYGERLRGLQPAAARVLADCLFRFSTSRAAPAEPLVLSQSPYLEVLIAPAGGAAMADLPQAAALLLFGLPAPAQKQVAARLARSFSLPPREAELAASLSAGLSIAETASAMGLTLETARNYSKRIYARMGVHGQAALMRKVYEGSALLG